MARIRWQHPGPTLFDASASQETARQDRERDARARQRDRTGKGKPRPPFDLNQQRLREIVALIRHRHGGPADTADADAYLRAALPHLLALAGGPTSPAYLARALAWWREYAPGIKEAEARELIVEAERAALTGDRSSMRADSQARTLGLSNAERAAVGIVTIGAIDRSKRQREADRKAKTRERCRKWREAKRAAAGKAPRSKTAVQAAKEAGISRSTLYRKRRRDTLSNATSADTYGGRDTLSNALVRSTHTAFADVAPTEKTNRPEPGPARKTGARRNRGADGPSPGDPPIEAGAGRSDEHRLSGGDRDQPCDMIGDYQPATDEVSVYARGGGIMPASVIRAVREAKRLRYMRQEDVARAIGVSRPQLANALQGRFGLSRQTASSLRAWLRN